MVVPNSELAETSRVERALNDTLSSGRVGSFQIDPTYLRLKAPILEQDTDYDEVDPQVVTTSFGEKRFWIILGSVGALILLAVAQGIFTITKGTGKTSSHKVTDIFLGLEYLGFGAN